MHILSRRLLLRTFFCIAISVGFMTAVPVTLEHDAVNDYPKRRDNLKPFQQFRAFIEKAALQSPLDDQNLVGSRTKRELTKLRYKDCGKVNRAIHFDRLSIYPTPIQVPGLLDLRIKANITRKLPPMLHVSVVLKKRFDNRWIRIPCIEDYGSCEYKDLKTCTLTQDVFGCPVRKGPHDVDEKFLLSDPGDALISQMLEGEYKAIVRARHPLKKKELACLLVHFGLRNKSMPARRPSML